MGGLMEVELAASANPPRVLAEAARAGAEALALQADADHTRRLADRDRCILDAFLGMSNDGPIAATAEGDVVSFNDTLQDISSMLGYQARGFLRGTDVVAALDAGGRPAMFTLDVRMPDMDGPTLPAELRQRGVRAPVLFCSGMVDVPLPKDDRVAMIEKPFKLYELASEVRRLIDRWVQLRQSAHGTPGA